MGEDITYWRCPECNGKGREPITKVICGGCDGTGNALATATQRALSRTMMPMFPGMEPSDAK